MLGRPLLAMAYLRPPRSLALSTTPGRKVEFRGGAAHIYDAHDMPFVLRREDVVVVPERSQVDWVPGWMQSCGDDPRRAPVAEVQMPEGFALGPAPSYTLMRAAADLPKRRAVKRSVEPVADPDGESLDLSDVGWQVPNVEDSAPAPRGVGQETP